MSLMSQLGKVSLGVQPLIPYIQESTPQRALTVVTCPHQMAALCKTTGPEAPTEFGGIKTKMGPGSGGVQPWAGFMGSRVTGN